MMNVKYVILLVMTVEMNKLVIDEIIYSDIMYYSMIKRLRIFSHGITSMNHVIH